MVITLELYKEIRKKRLNGMSQRQIAAALHISRNTVKKYWDGENVVNVNEKVSHTLMNF